MRNGEDDGVPAEVGDAVVSILVKLLGSDVGALDCAASSDKGSSPPPGVPSTGAIEGEPIPSKSGDGMAVGSLTGLENGDRVKGVGEGALVVSVGLLAGDGMTERGWVGKLVDTLARVGDDVGTLAGSGRHGYPVGKVDGANAGGALGFGFG